MNNSEPILEEANDYELADSLGVSVDMIRTERLAAFKTIQRNLRKRGYIVPDNICEFSEFVKMVLKTEA